jgi:hypothetical protein
MNISVSILENFTNKTLKNPIYRKNKKEVLEALEILRKINSDIYFFGYTMMEKQGIFLVTIIFLKNNTSFMIEDFIHKIFYHKNNT